MYAFNANGNKEYPDGVYRLTLNINNTRIYRGLIVEIDGDNGKQKQPRVTATKMWEHLMYSKLTSGGGVGGIKINGFTLRVNIGRAEVSPSDLVQFNKRQSSPGDWKRKNAGFWQKRAVRVLGSLLGSIVFCLRDIVMSMAGRESDESPSNWLFLKYRNDYHVNMFVGPFELSIPDNTVDTQAVYSEGINNMETKNSKDKYRRMCSLTQRLEWHVDFKCLSKPTCGFTQVQYMLIENFQGHMVRPEKKDEGGEWSSSPKPADFKARRNRGLMTLVDIVHTPDIFLMNGVQSYQHPQWKLKTYVGVKGSDRNKRYTDYMKVLNMACNLMQNFILYEINDSIVWTKDKTWPLREWLDDIAFNINTRSASAEAPKETRAQLKMTFSECDERPQSLVAMLKKSLCHTLPPLDDSVKNYMQKEGWDVIRDVPLYLRLVGVTNIFALEQLARTHSALMDTDKYHARVFNGLSVGTQSEMRLMFERIVINPRRDDTLSDLFEIKKWDSLITDHDNLNAGVVPQTNKLMRYYIEDAKSKNMNKMMNGGPDASGIQKNFDSRGQTYICNFLVINSRYFFTYGVYFLAQSLWFKTSQKSDNETSGDAYSKNTEETKKHIENALNLLFTGLGVDHDVSRENFDGICQEIVRQMMEQNVDAKPVFMVDKLKTDKENNYYFNIFEIEGNIDDTNMDENTKDRMKYEVLIGNVRLRLFIQILCTIMTDSDLLSLIMHIATEIGFKNQSIDDTSQESDEEEEEEEASEIKSDTGQSEKSDSENENDSDTNQQRHGALSESDVCTDDKKMEKITKMIMFCVVSQIKNLNMKTWVQNIKTDLINEHENFLKISDKKRKDYHNSPMYTIFKQYKDFKQANLYFQEQLQVVSTRVENNDGNTTDEDTDYDEDDEPE